MLLPRYAALSSFFAQIFILFYSPHLREYFTYSFVLNGAVFIELFTIYYAITGADKKKQTCTPRLIPYTGTARPHASL
jgi:4-hydroxybenzoate polyprenyltransferase